MKWMRGLFLGLMLFGCEAAEEGGGGVSTSSTGGGDSGPRETFVPGAGISTGTGSDAGTQSRTGAPSDSGKLCDSNADCGLGTVCFQGTCVGQGALRFSLSWTEDTDYDLHVITPSGIEISYLNPSDEGGLLDVDDCVGSDCRVPNGTHIENIFFDETPSPGAYEYWVHNYAGDVASSFELEVSALGTVVDSQGGVVPIIEPAESTHFIYLY